MNTFNNQMPKDLVTLEMRIHEDVRHVMKAMFISSEEKKELLENALEQAIKNANIKCNIEKYAQKAVCDAVEEYFTFGEGGILLRNAINNCLKEIIPGLFK